MPSESFRDIIYTADQEGHRKWVYAIKPHGRLYNLRTLVSVFYLIIFFTLPFLKLHGEPLFLLNIPERRFILFGFIFWPQDFFLFAMAMLTFLVFIIFFTVIYGRVFCGWACPQTVFMEMVFRRIEYWIEGSAEQQKKLNKQPWAGGKIYKKSLKHIVFFAVSFLIGNTFLAYIIGVDELFVIVREPIAAHAGLLIAMLGFSAAFYAVFAFLREMVCLFVCPYGRLQGVLLDKHSIVVGYDYKRGEPRGHLKHGKVEENNGDCIDCHLCVKVCPTGIDIRNGTQLECVNCTACIDACDSVMEKIHKPKGLIRYASENNIASGEKLQFTPRMKAYSFVLIALLGLLSFLMVTRTDVQATITRVQGQLYQKPDSLHISNLYNIKLTNKTRKDLPVHLQLEDIDGDIKLIGDDILVKGESLNETTFFLTLSRNDLDKMKMEIDIAVYSGDEKIKTVETTFFGPPK